jgi:hypothetical protein
MERKCLVENQYVELSPQLLKLESAPSERVSSVLLRGLVQKATCSPLEFTTGEHNNPPLERFFRISMVVLLKLRANYSLFALPVLC